MEDCIFCQIVEGKIPSYKVWENGNFLAFLDVHPASAGHTLVIPKKHFRWVWEVSNFGEYFEKIKEVALLLKEKLNADWIQMSVMGVDIPHAQVHLIPHHKGGELKKEDLAKIAKILKN